MRVAVFSDIHGNLEALEAIINDLEREHFDEIICLGDVLSLGPNSRECLDLIMNKNIRMLLGNHELYYINRLDKYNDVSDSERRHLEWVKSSLDSRHLEYLKKQDIVYSLDNVIFMHFPYNYDIDDFYNPAIIYGNNKETIFKKYDKDVFIFGHEHKPLSFYGNNKNYYCVGSSGCCKGNRTHYTVIEMSGGIKVYNVGLEFDRAHFESTIRHCDYPEKEFLAYNFFNVKF